jgi:hypothetical protein
VVNAVISVPVTICRGAARLASRQRSQTGVVAGPAWLGWFQVTNSTSKPSALRISRSVSLQRQASQLRLLGRPSTIWVTL